MRLLGSQAPTAQLAPKAHLFPLFPCRRCRGLCALGSRFMRPTRSVVRNSTRRTAAGDSSHLPTASPWTCCGQCLDSAREGIGREKGSRRRRKKAARPSERGDQTPGLVRLGARSNSCALKRSPCPPRHCHGDATRRWAAAFVARFTVRFVYSCLVPFIPWFFSYAGERPPSPIRFPMHGPLRSTGHGALGTTFRKPEKTRENSSAVVLLGEARPSSRNAPRTDHL